LLFWSKDFAATSMNDLCDALSVRSRGFSAAKAALHLEVPVQLQTIGPSVWGNFEGLTLAAALKTACGAKRGLSSDVRSVFGDSPMRLRSCQSGSVADS
jgi:hypothetical protein